MILRALLWIALILVTIWLVAMFVLKATTFFVHLLLIAALILVAVWLVQRVSESS